MQRATSATSVTAIALGSVALVSCLFQPQRVTRAPQESTAPASSSAPSPELATPAPAASDETAEATRGFTAGSQSTGELSKFTPVEIRATADACYLVVLALQDGATFDSNQQVMARWGAPRPETIDDSSNSIKPTRAGRNAIIPMGCLLGSATVRLRVEGFFYAGSKKANAAGHGGYTATVFSRTATAADRSNELNARKTSKQQAKQAQAARDQRVDNQKAADHASGCSECSKMRLSCAAGNAPSDWAAVGWTCQRGYQNCLDNRDLTVKACSK